MDEYGPWMDAANPDTEWTIRCAVIRITPGTHDTSDPDWITNPGLYIHANSGHINVGVTQVRIAKATGYLRVDTDGALNGVPLITGDETAATRGLLFGGSGGNNYVHLKCYKVGVGIVDLGTQADYDAIANVNLNLWIAWLSPTVRGVGNLSKADRALADLAALAARVQALESVC